MGTLPRACPGVRCPQFFVALAALILFVPLCCSFTQFGSEEDDALYRMCHNAIDTRDPVCLHGGHLYAKNRSHPDNCASCICPEGWAGVDCSLCTSKSVCPPRLLEDGSQQDATQCTKDSILPIDEEMQEGKMLSCECGGLPGDVTTEWVCQQQPGTNWAIHLLSNSTAPWYSEKGAVLSVYERAGIPSQDLFPERTCTKKGCISNAHYKYAYPAVWKGNLTGCSWGMGPCVPPLTGSSCFIYTCHDARIKCPPDDIPKCPGWTNTSCAKPPGEYQPYWTHHCLPMALPWPGKTSTVACNSTAAADGSFQCYLKQEDSVFAAAIGMRCRTGSCMYAHPSPGPPPTPPPAPPHHGGKWPGVGHREMLAILSTATLLVGMAGAAAMLIRRDLQSTKAEFSTPSLCQPLIQDEEEGGGYDSGAPDVSLLTPEQLPEGLMLSWEGIQYDLPLLTSGARRRILQGVSGITMRSTADQSASCVFALLGPSGAGKTTLLDILAGRKSGDGVHGRIRMGGVPVSADRMRHISGYVLQDDVLPGTSTVWEYLSFHAELRLPAAERQGSLQDRRVWNIIRLLGLTKIANSFIGDKYTRGLSSGEKRRVSIATELLTRPGLLFLDEPTTGLDSTNACKVVDILSSLSVRGVNVVLSIHQPRPDILRLLDRVLLLSGTGQQVYSGPVAAAAAHFESMGFSRPHASINIADFMLDTIIRSAPEAVDGMVQAFASSAVLQEDHNVLAQAVAARVDAASRKQLQGKLRDNYVAPFSRQVRVLSVRLLRKAYRHPFLIMLNYVATAVMAVVVGLIFWHAGLDTAGMQNRFGVLFFILLYLSLMSLSSLPIWRDDHLLFARERDAGAYGSSAYYLAMVAFEFLPMRVLPPSFFVLFTYWMVGLHPKCGSCVLWFLAVLVLANMAGAAMSMLIGAASPNNAVANMMCSIAILSCFLFSGFMLNKDAMHHAAGASLETTPLADAAVHNTTHSVPAVFEWLGRLSFANHAYEALVVNEYHHSPLGFTFDVPGTNGSQWHIPAVSGDTVLRAFGFRPDNFYVDLLAVLLLGAAFSAGTYLLLLQSGASQPSVASTARLLLSWLPLPPSAAAAATESGTDSPIRLGNCEEAPAEVADGLPLLQDKHCEAQEQPQNAAAASAAPAAAPPADGVRVSNGVSWPAAHGGGKPAAQALVLSWEGVEFRVAASRDGQRQQVLAGVCGIAGRRGGGIRSSVLAILGPSGAGKTTLLDILAGRLTAGASGSIRLNGHRVRPAAVRQLCGYVPDDDVFPGTSTVLEYLSFHGRLRLPRSVSAAARLARVQQLLQELGLAKVTLSTIGDNWSRGLSGGEKRRLTIAAELLTQPGLLFLDEPTTGLDSTNALNVVDIMARLAARGVTMVMSIHQPRPDIFRLLDQMLLLSGDGRPAFSGTTEAAPAFFAQLGCSPLPHVHIADHVLDLVIRSPPAQAHALVDAFAASAPRADLAQQILHLTAEAAQPGAAAAWRQERRARRKYTAPTWVQLRALSARMLRNTWRHRMMVAINFVSTALVAGGLGLIYRDIGRDTAGIQDRFGALFFMIMYLSLMSLSSLPIWREDRLLFMRERDGGVYSTGAYFWSVVMFDLLPMRVLPPLFFGALSYWMIGLRGPGLGHVAVFLLVLVQTNVLAASMSMAIGAASPSNSVANMIGGLAVLLSLLFAGYLLSREKMRPGIRWLSWLCHTRYAFEALLINEFRDNSGFRLTPYSPAGPGTSPVPGLDVDGNTILHMFGFSRHAFAADLAAMLAFTAGYLLLTFLLLRRRRR